MRKILWVMLFVLMALIFTSFTVTAQKYTSESVIDKDTGAMTKFVQPVELIPRERLEIDVSSESPLPWTFTVTQTDSAGKDLVIMEAYGSSGLPYYEKKIRKDLTSPGHYTLELISKGKSNTAGISYGLVDADLGAPINWHMSVTKYKPILVDPKNFKRDPVGSLLQTLNIILDDIAYYLHIRF